MKGIYLFILSVFLLQISFAQKETKTDDIPDAKKKELTDKKKKSDKKKGSLLKSENLFAKAYKLSPFKAPDSVKRFETFEILKLDTLNKAQIKNIKTLLNDKKSFLPDSIVKYCAFFPKMGITFIDSVKHDTLNVALSFSCDKIRFYKKDSYVVRQSDPAAEKFYRFYKSVFEGVAYTSTIIDDDLDDKQVKDTAKKITKNTEVKKETENKTEKRGMKKDTEIENDNVKTEKKKITRSP